MRYLILIVVVFCTIIARSQDVAGANVKRLTGFYTWYITANAGSPDKQILNDSLKKYCTTAFLKKMRANKCPEYDAILHCQDFDKAWVKTLMVTKVPAAGKEKYSVCTTEENPKQKNCVNVFLIKEGGQWKINKVID